MSEVVDRETVKSFLEACGNTNFQVIVRGASVNGAVKAIIQKDTRYYNDEVRVNIRAPQTTGLRSGLTPDAVTRVFHQALNIAEGEDFVRAIEILVESKRYAQVEMRPMEYISMQDKWGEQKNPAATLDPLVWRCEDDGSITTHGGARLGAGRPALGGKPVLVDMPVEMIDALNARAKERDIPRAELIRELLRDGLSK